MNEQDQDMPSPGLEEAFRLNLTFADMMQVGKLATGGRRAVAPVTGGQLNGERLSANVLSGSETRLTRLDGVTTIEAVYLIAAENASLIRIIGTGMDVREGGYDGVRMSIVFEVDDASPHSWLATRAFIAERARGSDTLIIVQII
ncbi:MAG: DUF3237 domain-containing protein [Sphingobium sp.]|nr:DUF3237 domain-containing protein [Sphingobium sp.]